jgi:hypothetical protein
MPWVDGDYLTPTNLNTKLPNPDSTINAASGDYVGTKEAKITLAIADAALSGKPFVWIPNSMLGYDDTLVVTNSAVQLVPEGGSFQQGRYDARAYGGKVNASRAIQKCCASLPTSGGIVDCTGFVGNQICDTDILFNVPTERPIKLIFGPSVWTYTGPNFGYFALLFGSRIEFNLNDTIIKLNDGTAQQGLFGSDQMAGVGTASVTNGSPTLTLAGALSKSVAAEKGKVIRIGGHLANSGARDNTTLNGAIDNVVTTIVLTSGTNQIASNGVIKVDNEIVTYATLSGATLTGCVRGAYGTSAASHSNGATVDRVVNDNYLIKDVSGLTVTLDRNLTAGTMTAVPIHIGPADCSFTGTGILDGNKPPTGGAVLGRAIWMFATARLKVERGIVFRHWDHGGVFLVQSQFASIDGSFINIGWPLLALGFSVLLFQGCKRCTVYGDFWRVNIGPVCDDRTSGSQIDDQSPEGNVFQPRSIQDVAFGVKFEGSSRTFAVVPYVNNWGVDGSTGGVLQISTPQWITAGTGLGNFADLGYINPTGQVATLASGVLNTFILIRTPACTVLNSGGTTNTIWTVGAVAGVNYGPNLANGIALGGASTLQSLTGASSPISMIAPDSSVQTNLSAQNTGTAAVPGRVGTQTNHQFGFLTNGLVRAQFDTSGNLVADTTNGGTFQDRMGSAANVAKLVKISFADTAKNTVSTSDVSITSYSLPANALAVIGQGVRVIMRGRAATQAGTPNIKFGATVLGTIATAAGEAYAIEAIITRTGAATQLAVLTGQHGTAVVSSGASPAETLSGAVVIDFRGAVTSGGTLTVDYASVEYLSP